MKKGYSNFTAQGEFVRYKFVYGYPQRGGYITLRFWDCDLEYLEIFEISDECLKKHKKTLEQIKKSCQSLNETISIKISGWLNPEENNSTRLNALVKKIEIVK